MLSPVDWVPAGTPPLVIKSSGKIAELEAQAQRELEDLQVRAGAGGG